MIEESKNKVEKIIANLDDKRTRFMVGSLSFSDYFFKRQFWFALKGVINVHEISPEEAGILTNWAKSELIKRYKTGLDRHRKFCYFVISPRGKIVLNVCSEIDLMRDLWFNLGRVYYSGYTFEFVHKFLMFVSHFSVNGLREVSKEI